MGENDTDTPPEGVSAEEWQALGDPGKSALRRERQARDDLQRQLAEARRAPVQQQSPPAPILPAAPAPAPPAAQTSAAETPVFSTLIKDAIEAAIAPLRQRFEQDDQTRSQQAFTSVLGERAGTVLADPRDAALLDASTLVDGNGAPDQARIDAALQQLVTDRPHLAKTAAPPQFGAPSAQGAGFGEPGTSLTPQQAAEALRTRYGA